MGNDSLLVILDNAQAVFYPGQMITGRVSVELAKELKVNAIKLKINGYSNVQWKERRKSGKRTVTRHYSNQETYLNSTTILFKEPDAVVLQPGSYNYPFQFQLPPGVPSSYEAVIGRVRYFIQASIDIPWAFDRHFRMMFTVVNLLDLNTNPALMEGGSNTQSKTLCCLCCESDPISATMKVDRLGYVPGEAIYFNSEINNQSNRTMTCSKAQLIMQVRYHARTKTKIVNNVVNQVMHGEIDGGGTDVWANEKLFIPPVPPSFLNGCNIIDIHYYATMTVDPSGLGFDLNVPVEVTIGSIPLASVAQRFGFTLPPPQPPQPAPGPPPPGAPQGLYSDPVMPPSLPQVKFAESAFGKQSSAEDGDNEHTAGNTEFAPQYAYYNFDKPDPNNTFSITMAEQAESDE